MGISMDVISEISGPVDDWTIAPEGYRTFWDWDDSCYIAKIHPEIPDVGWSYGNLARAWRDVIDQYPSSGFADRIGREGIIFPGQVPAILEYLSSIEPRPEHGEDFADRIEQLKRLFGRAAELRRGAIYSS